MRYDMKNKETGEITESAMPYADLEGFLVSHPELEVVFLSMNIGDPVILGVQRPPADFTNHVLAPIERRYNSGKQRETRFGRKAQQL